MENFSDIFSRPIKTERCLRCHFKSVQYSIKLSPNQSNKQIKDNSFAWDQTTSAKISPEHVNLFAWNQTQFSLSQNRLKLFSCGLTLLIVEVSININFNLAEIFFCCLRWVQGICWPVWLSPAVYRRHK